METAQRYDPQCVINGPGVAHSGAAPQDETIKSKPIRPRSSLPLRHTWSFRISAHGKSLVVLPLKPPIVMAKIVLSALAL